MSEGVEHLLAVQKSSRNCKQKKRHHVINKTTVLTNRIKHECASACVCVLVGTPCGCFVYTKPMVCITADDGWVTVNVCSPALLEAKLTSTNVI